MIHLAIVSSIPTVRTGLRSVLGCTDDNSETRIALVYEGASLSSLDGLPAPVDVLVITAEVAASLTNLRRLAKNSEGEIAILFLTNEQGSLGEAVRLPWRAWGALPLEASAEEIQSAVNALQHGLWVVHPSLSNLFLPGLLADSEEKHKLVVESLTERENQVLQLLARGLANKQIGANLGISEHTVKFHISSIYNKLGVTNRAEAVRIGVQQGLVLL